MAGGIFERKFEYNEKCVYFGGVLVAGHWLLPAPTVWTSIGIFTSAYIALAWYDEVYECKLDRLRHYPGVFNDLTGWLKPDAKPSGTY